MNRPEQQIQHAVVSHLRIGFEAVVEFWKAVPGWEGLYAVSNLGRVMRVAPGKGTTARRILKPSVGPDGYPRVSLSRDDVPTNLKIHRLVLMAFDPSFTEASHADHINGDVSDNRLINLRCVTNNQNAKNRGVYKTNKLGVKGVRFRRGKYEAQIQVDGRKMWLGAYPTLDEASAAYEAAATKHYGEFARSA